MNGKVAFVTGAAVGYVLGTRDGRGRYEQLKAKSENLWQNPKVRDKVSQATGLAQETVSPSPGAHASSGSSHA
jgi:hypothetical protein